MGCDIHMYLEFRTPELRPSYWCGWPRINPGRDYELFGHLAGVRNPVKPVVELRGVPETLSFWATNDWWILIKDEYAEQEGWTSLANAQIWAKYGSKIEERDGNPYRVTNPDWHSASWITREEFEKALDKVDLQGRMEYQALLAAMKSMESAGAETRLVFWFDN